MCSTITEGKTQEAKLFTRNPKAGMPIRAIEPKRQEMEKEPVFCLYVTTITADTQRPFITEPPQECIICEKAHNAI